MTQAGFRAALLSAMTGLALAGCAPGTDPAGGPSVGASNSEDAAVARAASPGDLAARDVESPEVFQATDEALWDGRPSLGGVWVASPDAVDPERVVIRNAANGNFVIGALFRRERMNPGPALQISSDAAAALGILAGAPTKIEVVALRRSTDAAPPPAEAPAPEEAVAAAAPEPAPEAADDDIGAAAVAAIDRSEALPPAAEDEVAADASDAPAAAPELAAAAPDVPVEPEKPIRKKRKWFWQKNRVEEPIPAALPAIEATQLPAPEGVAASPAEAAEVTEAALPTVAAPASGDGMIQIGIFSIEANAQRAVDMLGKAGVTAHVLTETAKGKTFWRVVAGPGADMAMLGKVKAAGFADAYYVKG